VSVLSSSETRCIMHRSSHIFTHTGTAVVTPVVCVPGEMGSSSESSEDSLLAEVLGSATSSSSDVTKFTVGMGVEPARDDAAVRAGMLAGGVGVRVPSSSDVWTW